MHLNLRLYALLTKKYIISIMYKNKNGSNLNKKLCVRINYMLNKLYSLNFLGIILDKLFSRKYSCSFATSRTFFHGSHEL